MSADRRRPHRRVPDDAELVVAIRAHLVKTLRRLNRPVTRAAADEIEALAAAVAARPADPLFAKLSAELLVTMMLWLTLDYTPKKSDIESVRLLGCAIMAEAERRGWPEGWFEDPSVIPGFAEAT